MNLPYYRKYKDVLKSLNEAPESPSPLDARLCMASAGQLSTWYAPFDYINGGAKIVLVGITPGIQQATNALQAAKRLLLAGESDETVLSEAKRFASFSGAMRNNLIAMLDEFGVSTKLGIGRAERLFSDCSDLVHYTSVLRYPVLLRNENYAGSPDPLSTSFLREQMARYLEEEGGVLPRAIWLPLGPKVAAVLEWAATQGYLPGSNILSGLQHPSGANAERIAYLLGRKPRSSLSSKTDPEKIDRGRAQFLEMLAAIRL